MIFIGSIYQRNQENDILKYSKIGLSNADNFLQYNIIKGIESNISEDLNIINVPNIGSYPKSYKKLILKSAQWNHKDNANDIQIGILNLPIIKHIIAYINIKNKLKNYLKLKQNDNIIIYSTYLPFLKAVNKLKNNYKITLIVTDLPELYNNPDINLIKKLFQKINIKLTYKYISRVNSFVLLTEHMKIPLQIGSRQYVVIEGMVDSAELIVKKDRVNENNKKIIMYTGALHYNYGIKNLLDAFKSIVNESYELWICGAGELEEEIKKLSVIDKRIKFYGYLSKKEVEELQLKSTVLINPRNNLGLYNKYSFPSKTLEYIIRKKPVIMYKLDGIPKEYDDYIYYIKGDSINDIAKTIVEVCQKSNDEIKEFAEKAYTFVTEKKNNIIQCKKITDMIQND